MKNEIAKMLASNADNILSDIVKMHVCKYSDDTISACNEGATLLRIASIDNDVDGDGFRYLIGLPDGVATTPHLSIFF